MIKNISKYLVVSIFILQMTGCEFFEQNDDLQSFIDTVKAKPKRKIDPDPVIPDYVPYPYNVSNKRSPFRIPINVLEEQSEFNDIPPEHKVCKRNFLFSFSLAAFHLIGDFEDVLHKKSALFKIDGKDGIFKVGKGDCIGSDYGLVTYADVGGEKDKNGKYVDSDGAKLSGIFNIKITEVVEDGKGGYLKRNRRFVHSD